MNNSIVSKYFQYHIDPESFMFGRPECRNRHFIHMGSGQLTEGSGRIKLLRTTLLNM